MKIVWPLVLLAACSIDQGPIASSVAVAAISAWRDCGLEPLTCNVDLEALEIEVAPSQASVQHFCRGAGDTRINTCVLLRQDIQHHWRWYPVAYLSPELEAADIEAAALHNFVHFLNRCAGNGQDLEHESEGLWTHSMWYSGAVDAHSVEAIALEHLEAVH